MGIKKDYFWFVAKRRGSDVPDYLIPAYSLADAEKKMGSLGQHYNIFQCNYAELQRLTRCWYPSYSTPMDMAVGALRFLSEPGNIVLLWE